MKKDKPKLTFIEFIASWGKELKDGSNKDYRKGQLLMILLATVWLDEYRRITVNNVNENHVDCFYNDNLIVNTIEHLKNVWID